MENNVMRQRVIDRLKELDLGAVEAALSVQGLERNFIRDLVERRKNSISQAKLELVARALKWSVPELLGHESKSVAPDANKSDDLIKSLVATNSSHGTVPDTFGGSRGVIIPGSELVGNADLPVFGTAQGGRGALILSNHAVDWVVRPAPLLRVADGYGMIIDGNSMSPAFREGWTALVNPHLPPRSGDVCIFRKHHDDGTVEVIIKELRRHNDNSWHVRQLNPSRDFVLKRSEWQICHVTVGCYFR